MSKFINKYVIIIIGFYVFWLGILPEILSNTLSVVCKNLSHNSNYKIEVINPKFRTDILPVIRIYADKISIAGKKDNFVANIDNFKIKFRILPLLSGKLHINSFRTDTAYISADLKNDVELDKDFFSKLENTKVYCDSINITKFDALLYQKETKAPIVYSGEDFAFKNKNRHVIFKVNSSLRIGNNKSNANINLFLPKNNNIEQTVFDVNVNNLDIYPFRAYFKHYLPKDLLELNGIINIDADKNNLVTELKNCSIVMQDPAKSIIFPDVLNIKSKFKIKRNCVKFEGIEVESDNIHAFLDGKVSDYFGKAMPSLDLNIRLNKSRVEDIVNLLPPFEVEDMNIYKLKKYKFYGNALANVSIKGRFPEPDITGNVFINNGILTKPIPNATAGATVKVKLLGRYANFDVNVPAGGAERVMVNGGIELYNVKYSDINVKSTNNVVLPSTEDVVNPLHEILNFIIGPVPILHVPNGTGNIDINVKGNRKNPHVWGVLNFYNAEVFFKEMPGLVLNNADAKLTFNDQNAVFKTSKGTVNGKDFSITGSCDVFGKFDFDVNSQNQPTLQMYKALYTATLVPDIQKILPKIDKADGFLDLALKVYGTVKYIEDLKINENAFAKGEILIKNSNCVVQNINVANANGKIKVDGAAADVDISATVSNAPMSIKAKVKDDVADLFLNIPKLNPNYLVEDKYFREKRYLPIVSVSLKYKGNVNDIEYDRVNLASKILSSDPASTVKYTSGDIALVNNKLTLKNIKGWVKSQENPFNIDLRITNAFSNKPEADGSVYIKTPDISVLNEFMSFRLLPKDIHNYIKDYELKSGALNLNCRINNNRINLDTDLNAIKINYIPLDLPIEIINGKLAVRNNTLSLNKVNLLADNMPILIDGTVNDILNRQNFDLYINSKPNQEFIDKYVNKKQIYPIKIKGDIVYWAKLKGNKDNFDIKTQFDLRKGSYFYYLGATIGDIENAISLYIDSKITGKKIKIKDSSYDKIIDSLSGKQTRFNLLKASGIVELLKDDMMFKDLHIKTSQPTDARIFNIIFRKPNIKQGQFTSDLRINNKLSNPRVLGEFKIVETDIPFIDVTVKNIELMFKDRVIEITSRGEVMGNAVKFEGILKNKLTLPYHIEKAVLYTKDLNLNRVVTSLKTSQVDSHIPSSENDNVDIKMFTANDFNLKADSIELRNIHASNFNAIFSLNEKGIFDVNRFDFNIAQGRLSGKYKYNLDNNDVAISLKADSIDANEITLALFDLKNQIYGDMTGTVEISCNGRDYRQCLTTLNGNTVFNVKDGRLPKLGSLEYLLKAGNLVKGGITGLSINSVIDLITPLKTGEFSDIFGTISIKDGLADDIEITTKGKDLNLFISGTYNFATENADMEVLGMLSRKISTMFGPIGNMSINTLFNVIPGIDLSKDNPTLEKINKIPGIELSSKAYRKFLAVIKGDINGDNYVTTFSWIN